MASLSLIIQPSQLASQELERVRVELGGVAEERRCAVQHADDNAELAKILEQENPRESAEHQHRWEEIIDEIELYDTDMSHLEYQIDRISEFFARKTRL